METVIFVYSNISKTLPQKRKKKKKKGKTMQINRETSQSMLAMFRKN